MLERNEIKYQNADPFIQGSYCGCSQYKRVRYHVEPLSTEGTDNARVLQRITMLSLPILWMLTARKSCNVLPYSLKMLITRESYSIIPCSLKVLTMRESSIVDPLTMFIENADFAIDLRCITMFVEGTDNTRELQCNYNAH